MRFIYKFRRLLLVSALLTLCYFPLFYLLDSLPIRMWDESRNAINAIEMLENGNFLISHYDGLPDMWNTKPPFLIWLQAFFLKIIGYDVFAVRLPSAIFAGFTIILILHFTHYYLRNLLIGVFSCLVLITTQGYVMLHGSRTGDFDIVLTFFTLFYCLQYFKFTEAITSFNSPNLFLFGLGATMAGLTKGVAAYMMLPAIGFYSLIIGKTKAIISNKFLYIAVLTTLCIVLGFYFLREYYNPGYLTKVAENELGGRYSKVVENNPVFVHDTSFYFRQFYTVTYLPWYFLFPIAISIIIFLEKNVIYKRLTLYLSLIIIIYIAIITLAKSKFGWYDIQVYPPAAIIIGIGLNHIFECVFKLFNAHAVLKFLILFLMMIISVFHPIVEEWFIGMRITPYVAITIFVGVLFGLVIKYPGYEKLLLKGITLVFFSLTIFLQPYISIMQKTIWESLYPNDKDYERYGNYINKIITLGHHNFTVLLKDYNGQAIFYQKKFNTEGNKIKIGDANNIKAGDLIVACENKQGIEIIKQAFNYEMVENSECITLKIISYK